MPDAINSLDDPTGDVLETVLALMTFGRSYGANTLTNLPRSAPCFEASLLAPALRREGWS